MYNRGKKKKKLNRRWKDHVEKISLKKKQKTVMENWEVRSKLENSFSTFVFQIIKSHNERTEKMDKMKSNYRKISRTKRHEFSLIVQSSGQKQMYNHIHHGEIIENGGQKKRLSYNFPERTKQFSYQGSKKRMTLDFPAKTLEKVIKQYIQIMKEKKNDSQCGAPFIRKPLTIVGVRIKAYPDIQRVRLFVCLVEEMLCQNEETSKNNKN